MHGVLKDRIYIVYCIVYNDDANYLHHLLQATSLFCREANVLSISALIHVPSFKK